MFKYIVLFEPDIDRQKGKLKETHPASLEFNVANTNVRIGENVHERESHARF